MYFGDESLHSEQGVSSVLEHLEDLDRPDCPEDPDGFLCLRDLQ